MEGAVSKEELISNLTDYFQWKLMGLRGHVYYVNMACTFSFCTAVKCHFMKLW